MNFGSLPTSKFNNTKKFKDPVAGIYIAKIEAADMKTSKAGNEYINVKYSLTDTAGNKAGCMFDMIMDSDKSFILYKIRRFLEAADIACEGEMELKDLALIIVGKELVVWATTDEYNGKVRLTPNFRDAEGYYQMSEYQTVVDTYNKIAGIEATGNESFMNVPDGDNDEVPFPEADDEF